MKAPTYTDKQIIDAGMQLLAENKRVTPFAIRNAIGGGNPKRIKKIWAESQHEAIEGQMVREQVDLPTEFEDALQATKLSLDELAKRMYNHAQEIAESRVRETITAARKAKESAEIEVAEAMDTVNSLDEEKQALASSLEKTRHKLEQANADNTRLQERIDTLNDQAEKNTELQKNNITLTVKKDLADQQLKEAQQHNTDQQTLIEQLKTDSHHHDTMLAIANTKQEESITRVNALTRELKVSKKAEEQAKREAAKLQGQLNILQAQHN